MGSCHDITIIDLNFINYEICKYGYNGNLLKNLDHSNIANLIQKLDHFMLKCEYNSIILKDTIKYNNPFSTYHTFTTNKKNSIFLWDKPKKQFLNTQDFILDQACSLNKLNLINYDLNNLNIIKNNFNKEIINTYITNPLQESILNKQQAPSTQTFYMGKFDIKVYPTKWGGNINVLKTIL